MEDLAQEALIQAYTDLAALREASRFRAWLIGITRNVIADWGRRSQSQIRLAEQVERASIVEAPPPTPEDDLERREIAEAVWAAVDQLPDSSREAVLLHYIGGLSDREIADSVGISASAVRSRLHYARQRLRDLMLPVAEEVLVRQRRTRRFTTAVMAALPLAIPRKVAATVIFGLTIKELLVAATGIIAIVGLLGVIWSRQEISAQEVPETTPPVVRLATAEQRAALQVALAEEGDTPEQGGRHVKLDMRAERLFPGSLNGCLRPALRAVGIDWSPEYLRGYLGRAFAFSMRPDGGHLEQTDTFDWAYFWEMLEVLDFETIDAVSKGEGAVSEEEYAQTQKRAWDAVRKSIDEGRPAISWQMYEGTPDQVPWLWSLIVGYDEQAGTYIATHPTGFTFEIAWDGYVSHGDEWFVVMFIPEQTRPFDAVAANRRAIKRAVEASEGMYPGVPTGEAYEGKTYPHNTAAAHGLAAWEMWLQAFDAGTVSVADISHHASFLADARASAAVYLTEVADLYPQPARARLLAASEAYDEVSDAMRDLQDSYQADHKPDLRKGAALLERGLQAEREALKNLAEALTAM